MRILSMRSIKMLCVQSDHKADSRGIYKLDLQDYASLAEVLASIGLVISLIFVGFQIRQNSHHLERNEENTTMAEWSAIRQTIITNQEVAEIWHRGLSDNTDLDDVSLLRLESLFMEHTWAAYHIWDRSRRGLLKHGKFNETMGPFIGEFLNTQYGKNWWVTAKAAYPPPFVLEIDKALSMTHTNPFNTALQAGTSASQPPH